MLSISRVRWYTENSGYMYAIKLDYSDDYYDQLKTKSVRKILEDGVYEIMKKCVEGTGQNGLRYYFSDTVAKFPGFDFPKTIGDNPNDQKKFFKSVDTFFE